MSDSRFPKEQVAAAGGKGMINHGPVVLVTVADPALGRANIIALAWATPVSHDPPLVAVSVAPGRHSHDLISAAGEFAINVPGPDLIKQTVLCGTASGRDTDKFAAAGLTPLPAAEVSAPLIAECPAHIECRVEQAVTAGDHTVFIARVVAASKDPGADPGLSPALTIHHHGGDRFIVDGELVRAGEL